MTPDEEAIDQFELPTTWCAGARAAEVVTVSRLDAWIRRMRTVCGHADLTVGCRVCEGVERVVGMVAGAGGANVYPER
jgi:hypothetical protein